MRSRVAETRRHEGEVEDTVTNHAACIRTLQTKVRALEYRAEDAENRSRRNNLRILGLPEGVEALFTEDLLRYYQHLNFPCTLLLKGPTKFRLGPDLRGLNPALSYSQLLNFRDRDELPRAARVAGELPCCNVKLLMFPDYTMETQLQHRAFNSVKAVLRLRH